MTSACHRLVEYAWESRKPAGNKTGEYLAMFRQQARHSQGYKQHLETRTCEMAG